MLSRRHLRIRVMQALYSCYQSWEHCDFAKSEQELFRGIEKSYDLYLFLLNLLPELAEQERIYRTDLAPRHISSSSEKPVVYSLQQNLAVKLISSDSELKNKTSQRHISWQQDIEIVKKLFYQLRISKEYKDYITRETPDEAADVNFCGHLLKSLVKDSEYFVNFIEEKNLYWAESFHFSVNMAIKTIKNMQGENNFRFSLSGIFKDKEDDTDFIRNLLMQTLKNNQYFESLIQAKTINWDVDRIALMDIILLKMALCEILFLQNVPVKVSINEYLEIAKEFSTPGSSMFINGIIDKLVIDLKNENKIVKTGRGLVE